MEEIFIKDKSQKEAQHDNSSSSKSKFQDTKEQSQDSQNDLSKMFVRPREELSFNKDRNSLGYDKRNKFHIPYYSKPIHFVCSGFHEEVKNITNKCQHCHRVGHLETQCFDVHPCLHCGKKNHLSKKCHRRKRLSKQLIMNG